MMMSLSTWRELIKLSLREWWILPMKWELFYILHCCGFMRPMIEDFIELGVDSRCHPVQISNHPEELKAKYGRELCFCGGFNNVEILDREDVTPEESREEIRRVFQKVAPGGSFVAWKPFFCKHPRIFF